MTEKPKGIGRSVQVGGNAIYPTEGENMNFKPFRFYPEDWGHLSAEDRQWLLNWTMDMNTARRDALDHLHAKPEFGPWLQAAIRLIEPHVIARRPVASLEILLDARWGHFPFTDRGGAIYLSKFGQEDHRLVHPQHEHLIQPLVAIPINWLMKVHDAVIALLAMRYGPLQYSSNDAIEDRNRVARKLHLHRLCPSESHHYHWYEGHPFIPGLAATWNVWRYAMCHHAQVLGWESPDESHRLRDWLPPVRRQAGG